MSGAPTLRVAFVGWGAIATTAAEMLRNTPVEIVAVGVRDNSLPRSGVPPSARLISDPDELSSITPTVVAEAAGRESVGEWGFAALEVGADFIVSSASAFADAALLESMRNAAQRSNAQVHIQPGALAGVEALSAARLMGMDAVEHRIVKPPRAWRDTPAEALCDLDRLTRPEAFFRGTATEAASAFPKNANVAMTTALAGVGPDATTITLVADPAATTNRHELTAHGAFGSLDVTIATNALPANPKTSAMAALSLVRSLHNRVSPIVL